MINCLLVDDEPYALELLGKHIAGFNDMAVAGMCRNIQEAIPVLQAENIDLLFLDVKMPQISGIEFLEKVPQRPEVILTTAYREYALQAYEYGVLDYLLKPISFLRFSKAVERYKQKQGGNHIEDGLHTPIVLKSGFEYHKIVPADILYIQSAKEYISVACPGKKYLVRSSMSEILEKLPADHFIQVHKSYIVPLDKIVSVTTSEVFLQHDLKVPVGRLFARNVKNIFK